MFGGDVSECVDTLCTLPLVFLVEVGDCIGDIRMVDALEFAFALALAPALALVFVMVVVWF